MGTVRRVYVEKKPAFAGEAKALLHEIRHYLGIKTATSVRVLCRYDVEDISDAAFEEALRCVFAEPPVDDYYEETFPHGDEFVFSVEYLPGQFDQRADSAMQCIRFLNEKETADVRYATTYVVGGELTEDERTAIESLVINPVDSRIAAEEKPDTLRQNFPEPPDVAVFEGFSTDGETALKELYDSLGLAMTFADFKFIQEYFRDEEKRDPTVTEIRVLDTYWSDHCRHTTFLTELKNVTFGDGDYKAPVEETFRAYLAARDEVYGKDTTRFVTLMDLALLAAKKLKREGKLADQEESDEINACSIVIPVDVNGKEEEWLLNFKNETHNHPTEIEPFGGAATCLGGAIRDPLSGRTYVYQAMRVTGAADPTVPREQTMQGKLPQKKLVRDAAKGYSSYGNQIGLATGYVKEIYHPDYAAKRMEIGAVLGAAPRSAVMRETSRPGDIIVLLGGRTGRDGIGGATGSSKVHTTQSIDVCGAEVQKGNAPTERKLQRLFRRPEVSSLIRKCNDFGAGGVSVAIGELADGLVIELDAVPKKYAGLDGTEIAISESQERMAVVVAPEDVKAFCDYADEENLETTVVATVTEEPRLVMHWRGKTIVDLSRAFMNTNGAHQEADICVDLPVASESPFLPGTVGTAEGWAKDAVTFPETLLVAMRDLNECSQRGLVEMFDSSIGAGTVVMPYGGKEQLTEIQTMVAKIPVLNGQTNTVSMMSYGFDPYLSSWSPYHGAAWAVTDSVSKIVAAGGKYDKIRFTFQEYFRRMTEDPHRWSQPFTALLGAFRAQLGFGLPSIGGKDSMSGTFEHIDVPPTLVSFAVDTGKVDDVITPELKEEGSVLAMIKAPADKDEMPDFEALKALYDHLTEDVRAGRILSAYVPGRFGVLPSLVKMAFGNGYGIALCEDTGLADLFAPGFGGFVLEIKKGEEENLVSEVTKIGVVTNTGDVSYAGKSVTLSELRGAWEETLESVFHSGTNAENIPAEQPLFTGGCGAASRIKVARPRVFIPVMPGTNCEYDSARAFEEAGAQVKIGVFRNLTPEGIRDSVESYAAEIANAQILMFPGGFSAGDEPDGSAKFFATAFRNPRIKEEVEKLLHERDGLILGICNGFQALIKLGLVPGGSITGQISDSPTLTFNTIGRHISRYVYTKVVSNLSPWLANVKPGDVIASPASHGEGRFVASDEWIEKLFKNGQVATQYCTPDGEVTMADRGNVNGSYAAIEGITSPDGRVFGKMAHVERRGDHIAMNISGEKDMKVFRAGVEYFA